MHKNQAIQIRETLNGINKIMTESKKISESYAFGKEEEMENPDILDDEIPAEDESPLGDNVGGDDKIGSDVNTKDKIKQMRKIAIELIMELDPSTDEIMYKSIKSIWDSCDKLLTKTETPVVDKNINNIEQ